MAAPIHSKIKPEGQVLHGASASLVQSQQKLSVPM